MPKTITEFDIKENHIYTFLDVKHPEKETFHRFKAIIDTGAPFTEFVDSALVQAGIIEVSEKEILIKTDLQSQKYGKIIFPEIKICGHVIKDFQTYVSRWSSQWGIGALIGLDFFRKFRVTIDYKKGYLITETYEV